jgi:acetate kinase
VRSAACRALAFPGKLEDTNAGAGDRVASPAGAPVAVVVVEAREDIEIARQVRATLRPGSS